MAQVNTGTYGINLHGFFFCTGVFTAEVAEGGEIVNHGWTRISRVTQIYLLAWRTCRELSLVRAPRKLPPSSAGAFSILLTFEASPYSLVTH